MSAAYPEGVSVRALERNADARGWLAEIHRDSWQPEAEPVQWVAVSARANSLRGLHAHFDRWELYVLLAGRAFLAMRDIRPRSPTPGALAALELDAQRPSVVRMPPAVLHGMYFSEDSLLLVGFSAYFTGLAEDGCRWNDPATGIAWPCSAPTLSARDAALPGYAEFLRAAAGLLAK
jgi:dTDP-4-dehydrorhamnose 3,5-epimerase